MANLFGDFSNLLSGGNQQAAEDAAGRGVDALQQINAPDPAQMRLQLQQLVQQGVITPQQAQVHLQQASAANGVTTDPTLGKDQMDALSSLQEIGKGGMTNMDRAQLAQIQSQEDTASKGARDAIVANSQRRGVGGSGVDLAAQLENQQGHASDQSARDTEVAGQAQARALAALQGAGQLGGQIQQQQFSQGMAKANANDAINQFNTNNMNNNSLYNTTAANNAQAQNLAEKQRVADANTQTSNTQQQYNKQLAQQDFENKYKKAGGVASAYGNEADQYNKAGQATTNLVGSGIQAGALYGTKSDETAKKEIKKFDASDFLNDLTSTKYKYKDPLDGHGEQVGVMAQSLEKKLPQVVTKGPDGDKMIDNNKSIGPIWASLASLNEKIKKMEKGKK